MFERFTERARKVVVAANEEARLLKHNYIGTEHLLLGLLNDETSIAYRALNTVHDNIDLYRIRNDVARIVGQGDDVTTDKIPFTPRAKKIMELALREALSLGHNYVGPEHLLLGLVRENEGVAARILLDYQAKPDAIRDAVLRELARYGALDFESAERTLAAHARLKDEVVLAPLIVWDQLTLAEARTLVTLMRKASAKDPWDELHELMPTIPRANLSRLSREEARDLVRLLKKGGLHQETPEETPPD